MIYIEEHHLFWGGEGSWSQAPKCTRFDDADDDKDAVSANDGWYYIALSIGRTEF